MSWNQSCCELCWKQRDPDRDPVRLKEEYRQGEQCSYCGEITWSGIYVRDNPENVPHPRREP